MSTGAGRKCLVLHLVPQLFQPVKVVRQIVDIGTVIGSFPLWYADEELEISGFGVHQDLDP